jgi:hypothetical protein
MFMAEKIDLAKLWKSDYAAPRKPVLLNMPEAVYLAIEGQGEPGGAEFSARVGALYAMAYTIKMTRKFDGRTDYTVSKLEAQWWGPERGTCFAGLPKSKWCWRLMIRTPEFVAPGELDAARAALKKRGNAASTELVKLFSLTEGQCVQMLHVGPYNKAGDTVEKMLSFASGQGLAPAGEHHEIYISDPRRVPAERLKTIMRQSVRPAGAVAGRRS